MKRTLAAALLVLGALLLAAVPVSAGEDKVTICHAAGLDGTTHYVTLTIGYPAVYGPAGHFYENGTTRAGHEEDYLGPCEVPATPTPPVDASPSPSATPTSSPSPAPSASPTAGPSDGPSPVPSSTPSVVPTPDLRSLPPTDTDSETTLLSWLLSGSETGNATNALGFLFVILAAAAGGIAGYIYVRGWR